jgi:hypothetical protein
MKKYIITYSDCNYNHKFQTYTDFNLFDDTIKMMTNDCDNYPLREDYSFDSDDMENSFYTAELLLGCEVDALMPYRIFVKSKICDGSMFVEFQHNFVADDGKSYNVSIPATKSSELSSAIVDIENGTGIKLIPQDDCWVKFKVQLFGRF